MPCQQYLLEICPLELARNPPWYLELGEAVPYGNLVATVHCPGQVLWKSPWMRDAGGIGCLLNAAGCITARAGHWERVTLLQNCQEMGGIKGSSWLPNIAACHVLVELGTRETVNSIGTCKTSAPEIGNKTLFFPAVCSTDKILCQLA